MLVVRTVASLSAVWWLLVDGITDRWCWSRAAMRPGPSDDPMTRTRDTID